MCIVKKWLFVIIVIQYLDVECSTLPLCSQNSDAIKLCKVSRNQSASYSPRPWPTKITPILDFKNVLDIDVDKGAITVLVTITLEWKDFGVSVTSNPK